ncbi:hypothetical protein Tco_1483584 [Tanacetum coccineum]
MSSSMVGKYDSPNDDAFLYKLSAKFFNCFLAAESTPLLAWCVLEYDVDDCNRAVAGYRNVVYRHVLNKQHIFDKGENLGSLKCFRLFEKGIATCWFLKKFKDRVVQALKLKRKQVGDTDGDVERTTPCLTRSKAKRRRGKEVVEWKDYTDFEYDEASVETRRLVKERFVKGQNVGAHERDEAGESGGIVDEEENESDFFVEQNLDAPLEKDNEAADTSEARAMVVFEKKVEEVVIKTMSSSNRSTFDIEDAFSTMNILNYSSVSSDYFPASSGSSSFNSSENSKDNMIPPVFLPFYNNPCLKDVQAFYAKELPISSPDHITPPAILTPSPILPSSLLFDP